MCLVKLSLISFDKKKNLYETIINLNILDIYTHNRKWNLSYNYNLAKE